MAIFERSPGALSSLLIVNITGCVADDVSGPFRGKGDAICAGARGASVTPEVCHEWLGEEWGAERSRR